MAVKTTMSGSNKQKKLKQLSENNNSLKNYTEILMDPFK